MLQRSQQTAEIVRAELAKNSHPRSPILNEHESLNEMYYGHWEGQPIANVFPDIRDISSEWAKGNLHAECPGNGESPVQVLERASECLLKNILRQKSNSGDSVDHICIVAHARLNQILISHCSGKGLSYMKEYQQGNCCVNVIDWDPESERFYVRLVNYRDHIVSGSSGKL
mmetsp:Transcript_2748/g.3695  ORF Transcript_2748/g.3695 Transcript_2748/m.3695 type:complete len:171 (-) Transcript_2748:601-1113(-)